MITPVNGTSVQDLMNIYPGQFDTVGKFEEPAKIRLKEDAERHVDRLRKCNVNLKPKAEAELKQMEDTGIIPKVREHTDWCSSIVGLYSTKRDGSLRICLDPKRLNESIKRCPHNSPFAIWVNLQMLLKGHCIEFKYYADGIHSGISPQGNNNNNNKSLFQANH